MRIDRRCIPCLARQAIQIAADSTADPKLQEQIIKASLQELANLSFDQSAPEVSNRMHQHAKRLTGNTDSYRELKATYNTVATQIADTLRQQRRIEDSISPFDAACRIAIAGNIIDFSAGLTLGDEAVRQSVEDSLTRPLFGVGSQALLTAAHNAKSILYLADNSGEIVFDRFLIELLPTEKVCLVVKGGPIGNDATMEDAVLSGLTEIVQVIDNGHDAQGTILTACSDSFRRVFDHADLIISKGQANFETLSDIRCKQIFFLLRAKCQSVASAIGCERMSFVLTDNRTLASTISY
ncbi:MAG: damage-control phosphatase ARMT1 family protein [Bacillota bacterium]